MPIIPLLTLESQIKRSLRRHLRSLGFERDDQGGLVPPVGGKETIRALHAEQRRSRLIAESEFINTRWPTLNRYFADGSEIDPRQIKPRLELIASDTWQSQLFRLASLTWSIPVSQGYGRRIRFLVWDEFNDKLIGLIALGDPVFNLAVRDKYIGWDVEQRRQRLVHVMDAYVLGAVPPYNLLLSGKLVAALIRSTEVRDAFKRRYARTTGIISRKKKKASLVLVTTTSALGRSSVYNRHKLGGMGIFRKIGFTEGWGHFHVPDEIFDLIRQYLRRRRHRYAAGFRFGDGPNWRLRATRLALSLVGMRPELLCHGIRREVYVCETAENALKVLRGQHTRARYGNLLCIDEISELARQRWLIPRAERRPDYRLFTKSTILETLRHSAIPDTRGTKAAVHGSRTA